MSARERRRKENRRHHDESQRRRLIVAGGLTAGATLAMAGSAHAAPATFTVGSNADTATASDCATPTNTDCTLRDAIIAANNNAGADTIVFASALSGSTITLTSDPEPITEAVDIQGFSGASGITVDGNNAYRIFYVDPSTTYDPVSISGMTLTNGYVNDSQGGAIFNEDADLTISNAVVNNSIASLTGRGGGIYSLSGTVMIESSTIGGNHAYQSGGVGSYTGNLSITDSTVTGNYADGDTSSNGNNGYGGGVWTDGAGLTITRSTIDHNVAAYDGGGIYAVDDSGSAVKIVNSTIANNSAANDDAGGVYDNGAGNTLTVIDSTVTGNTAATDGGGLKAVNLNSDPVLENSIVSGNTSGTHSNTDDLEARDPYIFDTSFSLIGVPDIYVNETVADSNITGVDPKLGPLADNGGPTQTMTLLCGSPAIDKGSAFTYSDDQRSLTRPVDLADYPNSTASGADGSDMGAVELQASPGTVCTPPPPPGGSTPAAPVKKKKCKKHKKKHKHSASSAKKKKCKKKKKKK
jgi:hypothetical protein